MTPAPRPRRTSRVLLLAATAALATVLTACTSDDGGPDGETPDDVLAAAKTELDETSGVQIELSTPGLPSGVSGLLKAEGVGTHQPAFEGDITVSMAGVNADVPVIAVDNKVYAILPFTRDYDEIDPSAYQAPDPAALMSTTNGLSDLLGKATGVEEGDQVRDGSAVLTSYTGSVPGSVVSTIIPSAQQDASFAAEFTIDDDGRLVEATMTGPFYPATDEVTYSVRFVEYDVEQEITAP
ncbi:LppX_LprAFG lipoprotein [Nocardioides massiliensis]|uniref:Lipoprotein LprG n=1 Tax=Nocardioides massiliensis TaxID=1325935 RepID=A0ABT9NSX2_9ACTN|nr:LppX_LprAFG lipoprotein [Nocardioides massiliensis]MDP9823426.1 lipoprotein LprG [Nocardioides massiliensis]